MVDDPVAGLTFERPMGFLIKWLFPGRSKQVPPAESVRNVLPPRERHRYKPPEPSEDIDEGERANTTPLPPLAAIAHDAFRLHRDALKQKKTSVLRESMPVLYFGNEIGYRVSKHRIVTLGLNPSHEEFPRESPGDTEPFQRFRLALPIKDEPSFYGRYFKALNNYFVERPCPWFRAFVPLLEGVDASYYPNANHRVIHTDLCSPLATYPAWSKLSEFSPKEPK